MAAKVFSLDRNFLFLLPPKRFGFALFVGWLVGQLVCQQNTAKSPQNLVVVGGWDVGQERKPLHLCGGSGIFSHLIFLILPFFWTFSPTSHEND